ncbi:hypothetical protein [Winogradskya humida]|uniref:CUB domain-containing protein n=1 Tax=Winogradskya humida TaxID=113566 RepID=A0ABQ3ZZ08_9ACTN|nr:hypothetical protein [Actinoplanes humidus]GIE23834.1 hypothetical protein Ahu01nite_069360 [Actinoplanes humidus]
MHKYVVQAVVAGLVLASAGQPFHRHPEIDLGCGAGDLGARAVYEISTQAGATLELRFSDSHRCAWGFLGTRGAGELWIDLTLDAGETWEGLLGKSRSRPFSADGTSYTPGYADSPPTMVRVCGRDVFPGFARIISNVAETYTQTVCSDWF